jgi:hypothetical protein
VESNLICESHRHTEQRNQENDTAQVLPYSRKKAPVEINLDIVAEETSPNHYIKSGNIPLALLLKDPFIPCLKTGSYF